jgi:hypothetical protein
MSMRFLCVDITEGTYNIGKDPWKIETCGNINESKVDRFTLVAYLPVLGVQYWTD